MEHRFRTAPVADPLAQAARILERAGRRDAILTHVCRLSLGAAIVVTLILVVRLFTTPTMLDAVLLGVLGVLVAVGVIAGVAAGIILRGSTRAAMQQAVSRVDFDDEREAMTELLALQIATVLAGLGLLGLWVYLLVRGAAGSPGAAYTFVPLPCALGCFAAAWWGGRLRRARRRMLRTGRGY